VPFGVIDGGFASSDEFGTTLTAWCLKYQKRSITARLESKPKQALDQARRAWAAPDAPLEEEERKGGLVDNEPDRGCCTDATTAAVKLILKEPVLSGLFLTRKFKALGCHPPVEFYLVFAA